MKPLNKILNIPIHHRIAALLTLTVLTTVVLMIQITHSKYLKDKEVILKELNHSAIRSTKAKVVDLFNSHIEELLDITPRLIHLSKANQTAPREALEGLSPKMIENLIGIKVFKSQPTEDPVKLSSFPNETLMEEYDIPTTVLEEVDKIRPLHWGRIENQVTVLNRSYIYKVDRSLIPLGIFTYVLRGKNTHSHTFYLIADFLQDPFQETLSENQMAKVFLMLKSGEILTHPDATQTVNYSVDSFHHPIMDTFDTQWRSEVTIDNLDGKQYYAVDKIKLNNVLIVSEISETATSAAMKSWSPTVIRSAIAVLLLAIGFTFLFKKFLFSQPPSTPFVSDATHNPTPSISEDYPEPIDIREQEFSILGTDFIPKGSASRIWHKQEDEQQTQLVWGSADFDSRETAEAVIAGCTTASFSQFKSSDSVEIEKKIKHFCASLKAAGAKNVQVAYMQFIPTPGHLVLTTAGIYCPIRLIRTTAKSPEPSLQSLPVAVPPASREGSLTLSTNKFELSTQENLCIDIGDTLSLGEEVDGLPEELPNNYKFQREVQPTLEFLSVLNSKERGLFTDLFRIHPQLLVSVQRKVASEPEEMAA